MPGKPYLLKTPGQKVVAAYKILTDIPVDDRTWDEINYPRFKKRAELLLKVFSGDVRRACECMEGIKGWAEAAGLDWTLDTVVKRAYDWKTGRLFKKS